MRDGRLPAGASRLLLAALPLLAGSLAAEERVTLKSGFDIVCDHHEDAGGRVRIYTAPASFLEVSAASIVAIETLPAADPPQSAEAAGAAALPAAGSAPLPVPVRGAGPGPTAAREALSPALLRQMLTGAGAARNIDVDLLAAVVAAESGGRPSARSTAGAEGLMQLMPQTAEFLARRSGGTSFTPADLATPQVNIAYGCYYLRYLIDHYGGAVVPALAAYNAGITNVDRWVGEARSDGRSLAIDEIPFPETRAYVQRVLHAQHDYRHTYAKRLGYA
jgi:soluble lytic murein transglycosylase